MTGPRRMKSLVYLGPKTLAIEETDVPTPAPGEIVVKVEAVGICGSELEGYLGHSSVRHAPLVMGHEFAGTVASTASDEETRVPAVGSRVVINPLVACGRCVRCLEGRPNVCRGRRIVGIHRPGAFAEYVSVPANRAVVVPRESDPGLASLAEPLAVCIHALKLGGAETGSLLVLGAGPIGLLTLQAARAMDAERRVLVVDRQPGRLTFAESLGALTSKPEELDAKLDAAFGSDGIDAAIDCVGVRQTREAAIRGVNAGGRVVLVGLGQDATELPMNHVVRQEISLFGSYTYGEGDFAQAVALLETGAISREGWTGTCSLEEAPNAFAELAAGTSAYGKIIVYPGA